MRNGNHNKVTGNNQLSERYTKGINQSQKSSSYSHIESYLRPRYCRLCGEIGDSENLGTLIAPCKCDKGQQLVHEECLKISLISLQQDLNSVKCESCQEVYKMNFQYRKKFRFRLISSLDWQYKTILVICIFTWILGISLIPLISIQLTLFII